MKHSIAMVSLGLFLVVDALLLVAVHQHFANDNPISADDSAQEFPASELAAESSDDPLATGSPGLELSRSGILAKISRGRCTRDSRPLLEISTDQGTTFTEVALPLLSKVDNTTVGPPAATVRTIERVWVTSAEEIVVIGSDEECQPRQFVTDDGGESWKQPKPGTPSNPLDAWRVDAAGTGVISSEGATEPGCDVVALAPVTDRNAKAACSDGTIVGTNDFGAEWVQLGLLDKVTGLAFATVGDGFAIAPNDGCAARLFTTANAGGAWDPVGCIAAKKPGVDLVGSTARLYALVDQDVQVSIDAGVSWSPATQDDN